jgi:glutamate 5-kinase
MPLPYRRLVVKIGSNVLTRPDGLPDEARMAELVRQLAGLRGQGLEVIVVSSGAVAAGRAVVPGGGPADTVSRRQLLAAVGQVKLLSTYAALLARYELLCAQVLVTKEDFRDRQHYQNMQNCFRALLQGGIMPIVNENDVVAVTELMFTDNDELAGLVAAMLNADALVLLTNVDGIFTGHPREPGARLIPEIGADGHRDLALYVSAERSQFGRGGMLTKSHTARRVARLGITVHIANGTTDDVLPGLLSGRLAHTRFVGQRTASARKKWLAHADGAAKGAVYLNAGACAALTAPGKAVSLLPVGVLRLEGQFEKGDIVRLLDEAGQLVGLGRAEYGADKARELLGRPQEKPLVHYDYLFLTPDRA